MCKASVLIPLSRCAGIGVAPTQHRFAGKVDRGWRRAVVEFHFCNAPETVVGGTLYEYRSDTLTEGLERVFWAGRNHALEAPTPSNGGGSEPE